MTLINDALRSFQAQTVINKRNHVHVAIDEMRRTLPTLVSTAVSTAMLMQNAHGISQPAPASSSQDHTPTLLPIYSTTPKTSSSFAPTMTNMRHAKAIPSQLAPFFGEKSDNSRRATHTGRNPSSPPHNEPSTPPSRSAVTSAPSYAPFSPTVTSIDETYAQQPAPYNLVTQRTMPPRFRQAVDFRTYRLENRNQTISSRQMQRVAKTANEIKLMLQRNYSDPSRPISVFRF